MSDETVYGTWQTFTPGELSVRQGIDMALGANGSHDVTGAYDVDGIEKHFRETLNHKLKDSGIKLVGDQFVGPAEECDGCREVAPAYIAEAVELTNLQFWNIASEHQI